jgi:hypothetical protein
LGIIIALALFFIDFLGDLDIFLSPLDADLLFIDFLGDFLRPLDADFFFIDFLGDFFIDFFFIDFLGDLNIFLSPLDADFLFIDFLADFFLEAKFLQPLATTHLHPSAFLQFINLFLEQYSPPLFLDLEAIYYKEKYIIFIKII